MCTLYFQIHEIRKLKENIGTLIKGNSKAAKITNSDNFIDDVSISIHFFLYPMIC